LVPCQDTNGLAQPGWPEWILFDQSIDLVRIIRVDNPDAAGALSAWRFQRPCGVDLVGVALKKRQVLGHMIAPYVRTCVRRRLAALQVASGSTLFSRQPDGRLRLTASGDAIAQCAEIMERQVDLVGESLGAGRGQYAGSVKLTAVPIVANRLLVPAIGELLDRHPALQVELIPESRELSLSRREADLAIRLARPSTGGASVKARRIGTLEYSVYAARSYAVKAAARLPWITYDDSLAHLPQAKWIAKAASGSDICRLKVHDAETAMEAVLAGLGKTLLPTVIGKREPRLRRLETEARSPLPAREMWLLAHADQTDFGRIVAVVSWLENVMTAIKT
jgi:DNA-binding transcriptional LysR family regulator